MSTTRTPPDTATLAETDRVGETFDVQTTEDTHEFIIATEHQIITNPDTDVPPMLVVWGDAKSSSHSEDDGFADSHSESDEDDFADGPIILRTFILDYVTDYGWTK